MSSAGRARSRSILGPMDSAAIPNTMRPVRDAATRGLQRSQSELNNAAQTIASAGIRDGGVGNRDAMQALASLGRIENDAAANARVLRAADEMLGTLIDTTA